MTQQENELEKFKKECKLFDKSLYYLAIFFILYFVLWIVIYT